MNQNKNNSPDLPKGEQKLFAARALYHSGEEQAALQNFLWNLLVDNCIKLQLSSASIKAGVTSLLDHTIFWANSTQYEFMRSIDQDINDVTDLAMLMMLAFRIQANRLELKTEPQDLNDILSNLRDQRPGSAAGLELAIQFPSSEAAVTIDYGFFLIALKLIIAADADVQRLPRKITITATANEMVWLLDFDGIHAETLDFLQQLATRRASFTDYDHHQAGKLIRLILAYWICQLQGVQFAEALSQPESSHRLRLAIPAA